MIDIDWSKAPKTSTHYQPPRGEGFNPVFWRVDNGVPVEAWAVMGSGDLRHVPKPSYIDDVFGRLIPRPAQPWSGNGLPPVGTHLEFQYAVENFTTWHVGECVAVGRSPEGEEMCVIKAGETIACHRAGSRMRPIKTPAQIAAELADQEVKKIAAIICRDGAFDIDDPEVTESAVALYDAGLRFPKGDDQ